MVEFIELQRAPSQRILSPNTASLTRHIPRGYGVLTGIRRYLDKRRMRRTRRP
jgi:hypothetical protein